MAPLDLAETPTPLTEMAALADRWGLRSLHVKRDDLTSPLYGGSKGRALEYLLGRARRAREFVSVGPHGSHHLLALAVFCREIGRAASAISFPQPDAPEVDLNARLLPLLGARVRRCHTWAGAGLALVFTRLRVLMDRRASWIPAGGTSSHGVLGIVEGALEVTAAVRRGELEPPQDVLVPVGSGGTLAGLWLGFALGGMSVRLVGVRVAPRVASPVWKIRRLARGAAHLLRRGGLSRLPEPGELVWLDGFLGRGYGRPTPEARNILEEVEGMGVMRLETTYTAKALAALPAGCLRGRRVLFWNTYSAVDPKPVPSPSGERP